MRLNFSTKAGTLNSLQGVLRSASIAPLYYFTVVDWREDRSVCVANPERSVVSIAEDLLVRLNKRLENKK